LNRAWVLIIERGLNVDEAICEVPARTLRGSKRDTDCERISAITDMNFLRLARQQLCLGPTIKYFNKPAKQFVT
jgi:hypothetical protein